MDPLNTCCILRGSRKPKISLHKIHTCFLSLFKNFRFLFSNTSQPPGFVGASIIADNSALWLFLFTNNCSTFEEKFHKKDPSDPMVSLKLQFVVDIRTARAARARPDCSANLRARRLGHHRGTGQQRRSARGSWARKVKGTYVLCYRLMLCIPT